MGPKDTRIDMIVDTANINAKNVDDCVEFQDNRKNPKPVKDPKNFTSEISAGEKVFWHGRPKDISNDSIEIIEIKRKNEKEPALLKKEGMGRGGNGSYKASVIDEYTEGTESYFVIFKIKKGDTQFQVDPKLQMEMKIQDDL